MYSYVKDDCVINLCLFANNSENNRSKLSLMQYTTFTFHFKEEHDLLCNWRSSVPSDVSGTNQIEAKLLE